MIVKLFLWAGLLLLQNGSFTLVSRARNSGSLAFNAIASTLSNGIWFAGQFIVVNVAIDVMKSGNWLAGVGYALWYTFWCVTGSVTMHYLSMRYIETGKRKVGA